MRVEIKLDHSAIAELERAAVEAAKDTMEQLHNDLKNSQTMPFDTGDMQNNQTFVDGTSDGAVLVTGSPQARRLYYHPEYNFDQGKNANAGGEWFEPYISGDKKDFLKDTFAELYKRRSGV